MLDLSAPDNAIPSDGTSFRDAPNHRGRRIVGLGSYSLHMCKYKG